MTRRRIPEWMGQFLLMEHQEILDVFDQMAHEKKLQDEQRERYRVRRGRNLKKALRIRPKLYAVRDFDIWAKSKIQGEDEWGDLGPRNREVKRLYAKRSRLLWIISTMYNYWAFDEKSNGLVKATRRTLTLSYLSKKYEEYLDTHRDNVRGKLWDYKQARHRARKEKREAKKNKGKGPFDHRLKSSLTEMLAVRAGAGRAEIIIKHRGPLVSEETVEQGPNNVSIGGRKIGPRVSHMQE